MNDPQNASAVRLASALRAGDADALAELFDAYADQLYGYCWFMLRNADLAQIALRDTLAVAQAHIGRLADTGNLEAGPCAPPARLREHGVSSSVRLIAARP